MKELLTQVLEENIHSNRGITFIYSKDKEEYLSYSELYILAKKHLGGLQKKGLSKGSKLIFQINDNKSFIITFWACIFGGITAVPVTLGVTKEEKNKLLRINEILNNAWIITSNKELLNDKRYKTIDVQEINIDDEGETTHLEKTDTVFIQFSSGSTGDPKGVVLSHSNLIYNTDAIISGIEVEKNDKSLSWMPLTHDMGLIGLHISPLVGGIDQYIMSTSLFINEPLMWLDKAEEHKTTIISSPNFGFKLILNALSKKKEQIWDLSNVKLIVNGAEPISIDTCKEFLSIMRQYKLKQNVIFPVYGLAEATLGVTFPKVGQELQHVVLDRNQVNIGKNIIIKEDNGEKDTDVSFVDLGTPAKYTQIRITNDEGKVLQEEYVGNIEIIGKGVTKGYYNSMVNSELYTEDKWMRTGDVGFMYRGHLYITGRKKDIIFINGQNYYSSDIENFIEKKKRVETGGCVVCTLDNNNRKDELYIFIKFSENIDEFVRISNEIKNDIAKELRLPVKYVIPCSKIHKTTSGKVKRYKFIEEYKDGIYDDVINEIQLLNYKKKNILDSESDIESQVIQLFKDILNLEMVGVKDQFIALGGDSLKAQQLISKINKVYKINIELRDVYEDLSVDGITKKIISSNIVDSEIIPKCSLREEYPVLPSQEQLYILNEMPTTDKLFNLIMLYDVVGKVEKVKLQEAINKLIEHYEILRTSFDISKDGVVQKVHKNLNFIIQEVKIADENLYKFINDTNCKFNLNELPLFKIILIKLDNEKEMVLIITHHIIVDGTSFGIFIKKLHEIYNNQFICNDILQFKDYAVWRKENLVEGTFINKKKYWESQFLKGVPKLELSIASKEVDNNDFCGSKIIYKLSPSAVESINLLSNELSLSKFTILFAAYSILLSKYGKTNNIVIGVPYANRKNIDLSNSIGMFINTLPISVEVNSLKKIDGFLKEIQDITLKSFNNCEYYSEELLRYLQSECNITSLYNAVLIVQNMDIPDVILDETRLKQVNIPIQYTKTDVTFEIFIKDNQIEINLEFLRNKYKEDDMYSFVKYYENILNNMGGNVNNLVLDMFYIDRKEKSKLLNMSKFSNNKEFESFIDLLYRSIKKHPNNIALKNKENSLTYYELGQLVNKLSQYLKNIMPINKIIGVWMNHSIEQIVTILAILKAGGAYLPIDKMHPLERMDYILKDSNCELLITDEEISNNSKYCGNIFNVKLFDFNSYECDDVTDVICKDSLAYIIYTSGSTGMPKGVMVEHGNLLNYIKAFLNEFNLKHEDIMMQQASVGFDASVEEIYPILTRAGTLSIADKYDLIDTNRLYNYLNENKITILSASPHLLNEINKVWHGNQIHTFISGGDVLRKEYIDRLLECGKVYNTYGPTETTVCATYYEVQKEDGMNIPIGHPIKNYEVYILNKNLEICDIGEEGEICISGLGVTRGYLNNEELTHEKFIQNPYNQGYRLYRTGDIGCWLKNGQIEYKGRCDNQLNIRGYRIEVGEIEVRLLEHNEIEEVIVIGKEHDNELYLCAYIKGLREFSVEEMRNYLKESLPDYMIPTFFVNIKSFPMNVSGKIDKTKLPEPFDHIVMKTEYKKPETNEEKIIADIWTEILGIKKIGINDNFFNLGGQSLKAIMLANRLEKAFCVRISINYVFENLTIKDQAKNLYKSSIYNNINIKKAPSKLLYQTSYMQKDMFSIQDINKQCTSYNIMKAMKIEGKINIDKVKEVIDVLIQRHESFRTAFMIDGTDVYQKVYSLVEEKKFTYINAHGRDIKEIIYSLNKPFDLKEPGAFHIYLIEEAEDSNLLLINIHHIIADATSIEIFLREFLDLYEGRELKKLNFTYKDYAEWQNEKFSSNKFYNDQEFWSEKLEDNLELLQLPYDFDEYDANDERGETYSIELSVDIIKKLNEIKQKTGTTSYMLFISAFSILLSKHCNQQQFILGSPVVNRNNSELFDIIGVFINTLIHKFDVERNISFVEFLNSVKKNTIEMLNHQEYPFSKMEEIATRKHMNMKNNIFNVMFSMIELQTSSCAIDETIVKPYNISSDTAMFDLTLEVMELNESLTLNFEYKTGRFLKETIEKMADRYIFILEQLIRNPDCLIKNILITPKHEEKCILKLSNSREYCIGKELICESIDKQYINNPNNIALKFNGIQITYKELYEKTNKLARYFRDVGIHTNDIIAIYMDSTAERIITMLAVLKSGAAYLPIDKSLPINRIEYMLMDSKAKIFYTDESELNLNLFDSKIVNHEVLDISNYSSLDIETINSSSDLAYIIYTSGSTGVPKGVMVEHRNLSSYVDAFLNEFNINESDVMMQQASISFDASIEEIFPTLTRGGSLVIAKREELIDTNALFEFLKINNITIISVSPYLLNEINKIWTGNQIHSFISGGDILRKEYYSNLITCGNIYNTYGPTETTVCATYYKVKNDDAKNIAIGTPIKNYAVYILDNDLNLCPIGISGEICISGAGVTRGYLNNEQLTNQKYIKNSFDVNERLYLSGDLGRWLPNGEIEFLGRKDSQVNIRGYRIEIGEIESRLLQHEEIDEAVVISKEYKGEPYICAYVKGKRNFTVEELTYFLKKYVPSYMIPSYFVNIESIPLNSSGKIDKRKLPEPFDKVIFETEYLEPKSDIEIGMAKIWSKLLGVSKVGLNDNFFDLGGQSLKAIVLTKKVEEKFGVYIPTSVVFKNPCLKDLCSIVGTSKIRRKGLEKNESILEEYKVSQQQRNLFVLQQMSKESTQYNMPAVFLIKGKLDISKLQSTLNKIIKNNAIYRTSFHIKNDIIIQKINNECTISIEYNDDEYSDIREQVFSFIRPFDLQRLPLIRVGVNKIEEEKYIVIFDIHHIISDAKSIEMFMDEILQLYHFNKINEKEFEYIDFSKWQNKLVESVEYEEQKKYWLNTFEDIPPALNLPTDYLRPAKRNYEGNSIEVELPHDLSNKIARLVTDTRGTNFMFFYTIYTILLSKYTYQDDFVIGIPTQGRNVMGTDELYGNFVNTLAIRNLVNLEMTFTEYFDYVKGNLAIALDNQDYSFDDLVNELKIPYSEARNPLFDTMFSYLEESYNTQYNEFSIEPIHLEYNTAKFDLGIDVIKNNDSFSCVLNYSTQLFKEGTMRRLLNYFINVLNCVVENKNIFIANIDMMSKIDKEEILYNFNQTDKVFTENRPIVFLIEDQCIRTPNKIAVVYKKQHLTYNNLYLKSNALAHELIKQGVGPGDFIPVIMGRSLELVVSIYSIMKTGAAFVPIDINWPVERIKDVLKELDSKLTIFNTESKYLAEQINHKSICFECAQLENNSVPIDIQVTLNSSLYMIYTSGSTGKPKGVIVPNQGILNRFLWMNDYFGDSACKSVLQTTNHIYDSSVWQFFWPLINGGKTILPDSEYIVSADYIVNIIYDQQITMIDFVPSVFNTILYQLKDGYEYSTKLKSLKTVILGGEEILPKAAYLFKSLFKNVRVFNLYGPTEASIGCICHEVVGSEGDVIPIGKPISNVKIYILDSRGNIVPIGVPGEIYIYGICLANGYYKDNEKTKASFIENPLKNQGGKVYKTGDIAKYGEDGEIIYLGRKDNQVKIRGFRIELGEIESVIRSYKEITEAVVVTEKLENNDIVVCAYIVGSINEDELKEDLINRLPYYMVPTYIYKLESIPLTPSGKINRKSLPKPALKVQEETMFIPTNYVEEKLVKMYKSILKVDRINGKLNFFEHGGNSLSATILLARVNKEFRLNMSIADIFTNSYIPVMAQKIANYIHKETIIINRVEEDEYYEASPAQKRMLILNSLNNSRLDYNIPVVFKIKNGKLNVSYLEECINQILIRHEALRTFFGYVDGVPVQFISDNRLTIQKTYSQKEKLQNTINELIRPFDLMKDLLIRVHLIYLDSNEEYLFIDMHHIISDGVSIELLFNELQCVCSGEKLEKDIYQYKDYSDWYLKYIETEEYCKKKSYWLDIFKELPPNISFENNDIIQSTERDYEKSSTEFIILDEDIKNAINRFLQKNEITLYMYMLSVFNTLLYRLTQIEDIAIGTPVSGRTQSEFENTIGLFVNTIVLRSKLEGNQSFIDLLLQTKETVISGIENQEYGIDDLVSDLKLERNLESNQLFNTMYLVERVDKEKVVIGDVELEPHTYKDDNLKFDMNYTVIEYDDSIKLELAYKNNVMRNETAREFLKYLNYIIEITLEDPTILLSDIRFKNEIDEVSLDDDNLDFEFQF